VDVLFMATGVIAPRVFSTAWWRRQAAWRYRRLASSYDLTFIAPAPSYMAPLESALSRLEITADRILDVSTGTGAVALRVARRFPRALVCACDLSCEMLRVGRRSADAAGIHIAWQQADGARLPYRDASFDLVLLQNAPPTFSELARVARPGAMLVLCYTKGGRLPGFLERRLVRRFAALRIPVVELGRVAEGLYVIAHRIP
jgi:ubiquinone/menaquinone biosynthesis C-methylase UbiE